jgi:hypothetical protein
MGEAAEHFSHSHPTFKEHGKQLNNYKIFLKECRELIRDFAELSGTSMTTSPLQRPAAPSNITSPNH